MGVLIEFAEIDWSTSRLAEPPEPLHCADSFTDSVPVVAPTPRTTRRPNGIRWTTHKEAMTSTLIPLERATAIRTIADEPTTAAHLGARLADALRELDSVAAAFARATAREESPDPQGLAMALGAARALLLATADTLGAVEDAHGELHAALVLPDGADLGLEAAAARRFGPRKEETATE